MKAFVRRLFDVYVFCNIHVALCAVALTLTTQTVLSLRLRHELVVFVFWGTLFSYNLQRLPSVLVGGEDRPGSRSRWNAEHVGLLSVVTLLAGMAAVWSFSTLYLRSQAASLIPASLSLAYVVPVVPCRGRWRTLRDIPSLKVFVIAATWAACCVLLPIVGGHQSGAAWISPAGTLWATVYWLLIFALAIPFDIRDLPFDADTLVTLPALLGLARSNAVAIGALAASGVVAGVVLICLKVGTGPEILAYTMWCALESLIVWRSSPTRSEYFFSFAVDGSMLLLWGMIWIAHWWPAVRLIR